MHFAKNIMAPTVGDTLYPRPIQDKERDMLESVLPIERPGYRAYRELLAQMVVLGEGRRGRGNLVLGFAGDTPDIISPLGAVVAYGMVEATRDTFSITVREYLGKQIDVEIVSAGGEEIPQHFEEKRRWTYSDWQPGMVSPASGAIVREVSVDENIVLVCAKEDKRIWVYDSQSGIVHLIPITNFYNELMLLKNIRDPNIALRSTKFFDDLDTYSDDELRKTFMNYNKLRPKVSVAMPVEVQHISVWKLFFQRLLGKTR